MPVYGFRCPRCLEEEEALVPMANRNNKRFHSCGAVMDRLMSVPSIAIFRVYPNDTIKDTLNKEEVIAQKDGKPVRSKRSQDALYSGIDYVRPLEEKIFTGF